MKITLIAALGFTALVGCVHTPETVQPKYIEPQCTAEYRPHLCVATIGSATYGGYGTNKCLARRSLLGNLERARVMFNEGDIQCGEVMD